MADMRTPLGRVRGLGSAKSGTEHFWHQRLTAIANVPLVLFFIGFVIVYSDSSYEEVRAALAHPFVALMIAFSFLSVLWHMRIGMQVVIEDYVHAEGWKVTLFVFNAFFPVIVGAAALYALLKIAFGG